MAPIVLSPVHLAVCHAEVERAREALKESRDERETARAILTRHYVQRLSEARPAQTAAKKASISEKKERARGGRGLKIVPGFLEGDIKNPPLAGRNIVTIDVLVYLIWRRFDRGHARFTPVMARNGAVS